MYVTKMQNRKLNQKKISVFALAATGITSLTLSALYVSSYLAILGVTILFWGALLLYIAPAKHVPATFLTASTNTSMSNIERILTELKYTQKAIYLPPKNLQDIESSLAFIPKEPNQTLPATAETTKNGFLSENLDGLFLTPPGCNLSKIYEEKIGFSFNLVNPKDMQRLLSKALTEDLEIIEDLEIAVQDRDITIELKGSIFDKDCQEAEKYPLAHAAVGCLLTSSLACALAKASGKPVTIDQDERSDGGKSAKIRFKILED